MKKLDLSSVELNNLVCTNNLIGINDLPVLIFALVKHNSERDTILVEKFERSFTYISNSNIPNKGQILNGLNKRICRLKGNYDLDLLTIPPHIIIAFMCKFGTKISKEILKGYKYLTLAKSGTFFINTKRNNFNRLAIDWGESMKHKKRIEENGGIAYQVLERDSNNKVIRHNGGEEWMQYFTTPFKFWWAWDRYNYAASIPNFGFYRFKPTRAYVDKSSNVEQLAAIPYEEKLKRFT